MSLKIRHKLFLAILIANILVVGSIFLLGNWIFSSSFRDYLDANEASRLAPLADELAVIYSERGNWRWVRNRQDRTWPELMREYSLNRPTGQHRPPPPGGLQTEPAPPPPPRDDLLAARPGLLLQNSNKRLVIGRESDIDRANWIPVKSQDSIIGYLGFVRRLKIDSELDGLFIDRLKSNFVWMALGVLMISVFVSVPLSRRLVRPLEQLRRAADRLASGDYEVSLQHQGNDEIGQLTLDFNRLAKTLSKNLIARQQWIADISHELRTPVAILQGDVEAIQDGVRDLDIAAIHSLHEEILRLSRLVNDLHELSMSDLGALSYQRQNLDLVQLVQNVIQQHRTELDQNGISISFERPDDSIEISADYQRLHQLFSNLALNSRHYTQAPGKLVVSMHKYRHQVVVRWSDSAPGVTDNELEALFDRLYRVEASRNRNTGGSGLGLVICKNIAEASNGSIVAEHSSLGGVSFLVTLPLNQSRQKQL